MQSLEKEKGKIKKEALPEDNDNDVVMVIPQRDNDAMVGKKFIAKVNMISIAMH